MSEVKCCESVLLKKFGCVKHPQIPVTSDGTTMALLQNQVRP